MPQLRARTFLGVATMLALVSAGCSDSNNPDEGLTDQQAQDVGATAGDEAETTINAFTVQTSVAPVGTGAGCISGPLGTDSDGDGIPDNSTVSFTVPPCSFDFRGGTLALTGVLNITDPTPTVAGFAYTADIDLQSAFSGDRDFTTVRRGTRVVSGIAASLTLNADLTITRTFDAQLPATVNRDWVVIFSPETQILINQPLPSGELSITGSFDWSRGSESFSTTVSTARPLQYDATCTNTAQRIRDGELRLSGEFNGKQGYVAVQWDGCGKGAAFRFVRD